MNKWKTTAWASSRSPCRSTTKPTFNRAQTARSAPPQTRPRPPQRLERPTGNTLTDVASVALQAPIRYAVASSAAPFEPIKNAPDQREQPGRSS